MPSTDYLIGPARGEIRWYPAVDGQSPMNPPHHEPGPWPWSAAVSALAEAASLRKVAASFPGATCAASAKPKLPGLSPRILDEWCGTRRTWPGPEPALLPWSIAIAGQLAAMANSHPAGFLRDELLRIAGQALLGPFGRQQQN
jgi:hypothetical protein